MGELQELRRTERMGINELMLEQTEEMKRRTKSVEKLMQRSREFEELPKAVPRSHISTEKQLMELRVRLDQLESEGTQGQAADDRRSVGKGTDISCLGYGVFS